MCDPAASAPSIHADANLPMTKPKKPIVTFGHLTRAGKWARVVFITMAAILGLLANARNLGLAPWLRSGVGFADFAARRVILAPTVDTLRAVGDTLHLAATVTDERGTTIAGTTIVWTTDDSTVAIVDSAGDVVARGAGSATISGAVREHRASSRISVWQRVRSVAIAHDTLIRLAEGSSLPLVARALDGRGHPVKGRELNWVSTDSAIVTVNAGGYARAAGPGRTTLTASIEGYTASLVAEVSLTPASVQIVSGDNQRGPAGRQLPLPIQVQVISHSGKPVPNAEVSFATDADAGSAEPAKGATDRSGRVRAVWTLGAHPGRQRLRVIVSGMDSVITVGAEGDPVAKHTQIQLAHEIPAGTSGARLADSVGIRVTDGSGAAAADVSVAWSALDGGAIVGLASRTDSLGEAWARWTLGPRAGRQHARVQVGNPRTMPVFTIRAAAVADSATRVELVSGGGQQGRVGSALEKSVLVRVTDRAGNPTAGASVAVSALAGTVADSAPVSDSAGRVRIHWTLGRTAGAQQLLVSLRGNTVKVSARAAAAVPSNIALSTLPESAAAGRALVKPVIATVTDIYGNVVADAPVVFTPSAGAVSPARAMTDAKGTVQTKWTLGKSAGDQMISATVRGTSVRTSSGVRAEKKPAK